MKKGKEKRRKITFKKKVKRPYKCIFLGYKLKKMKKNLTSKEGGMGMAISVGLMHVCLHPPQVST